MKKLKVVHVVEALGGGVYSYFCDLSKVFAKDERVETYIIYSSGRNEVNKATILDKMAPEINYVLMDMASSISPVKDAHAARELAKLLNGIQADIIHLHSSKAGVIGKLAIQLSKTKSLVYYTPHGYSFLRKDISASKRTFFKAVERSMSSFFPGSTVACGDTEYNYAKNLGEAYLIRNGVNLENIRKHLLEFSNPRMTVGILGRITFARNPPLFNRLAHHFSELDFMWIGDGDLRDQLTAPNIKITGWFTDREEGLRYLNGLDVYLQPSLWEGLPISIIEAMALEKPVVASKIVGNKDLVRHGQTGFLFESFEVAVQQIESLKKEELRRTLGQRALKVVEENFDCTKNFSSLIDLYVSHLGNKEKKG
ncbi:glycosyltransferase [Aureicoccus marinus]|uniref:Glycosyltransferase subfamily 4-like N-terminal domain-containing protein n=1 Tax=Aureicoccus marinus TaxID=754435 RepID=A0A2S7T9A3_9FLAO|nr:glycosyltransferase [Aureicoccus marinus]PQJ16234.1 hypothetical protein BST99_11330 [Aureicoccus marinus]